MSSCLHLRQRPLHLALAAIGYFCMPAIGHAQTTSWQGGVWDNPGSWSAGVPTASSAVIFNGSALITTDTDMGSLVGSGSMNFIGGGPTRITIGYDNTSTTFAGQATGTGGFTKVGSGTLTLSGANTNFEDTIVNAGTLQAGASNAFSGTSAFTVNAGATLALNGFDQKVASLAGSGDVALGSAALTFNGLNWLESTLSSTFSGTISGTGGKLLKQGNGTLTLTGTNTYTGGTTINAGTLAINNGDALGSGMLTINAGELQADNTLTLNNAVTLGDAGSIDTGANNLTMAGAVGGTGDLTKLGSGTLTFSGANSYSGDLVISAGTVATVGSVFTNGLTRVVNNATLDISGSTAASFKGLSGNGSVLLGSSQLSLDDASDVFNGVIDGNNGGTGLALFGGHQTLNGINTYTGLTTILGGTLIVGDDSHATAVIAGNVMVSNTGTIGGIGRIGGDLLLPEGTLSPGNSIGTLTVGGNLSLGSGSIYRVEVNPTQNDRLNVGGTASLNGIVDVQAAAGTYAANTQYTIVNATGGLGGTTFSGVTSNLAFLTPTLSYDANNAFLQLARNDVGLADVANTRNQRAVGSVLSAASAGASGDLATVTNAITGLSAGQARAAYDAIGGAGLVALRRAGSAFAGNFGGQLQTRLSIAGVSAARSANGIQLAANDHVDDLMPAMAQAPQQRFTLAGGLPQAAQDQRGFWLRGYGSDYSADGDGNAASTHLQGTGLSAGFDARVSDTLVLGAALTHGRSDISAAGNEDGDSSGNAVALYASYGSGAWNINGYASYAHNNNSMQRRLAFGGIDRTASSDFDSNTFSLYGEVSYDLPQNGWTLQPLAAISASRNKNDGFTETGADALNLQVDDETVHSAKTLLGARAVIDFDRVQLQPRAMWAHEFGNANVPLSAQLQGGAAPFAVYGIDLPRDSLVAGLTVVGKTTDRLSLFADMQGEFNSRQTDLALLLGLRVSW